VINYKRTEHLAGHLTVIYVRDSRVDCSIFKSGLIASIATSFPDARHCGCHFHFCQAIYRKVQDSGLTAAYDDREARNNII